MKKGIALLIIGVVSLITVYSVRPPSGFGEALIRASQGSDFFLKEPVYLGLMVISVVILIFGVISIVKNLKKDKVT